MNLEQQMINTIIVSIPEEFFITMLILILLKKFNYLSKEYWKENLIKILTISVIPMAILSNVIEFIGNQYNIGFLNDIKPIIGIIITAITISVLCNIKTKKEFLKILFATLTGFIIFILTELLTVMIAMFGLDVETTMFNESPCLNFIILVPERLIQYGFLTYIFIRKNSLSQAFKLIDLVITNKILKYVIIIITITDLFFLLAITKHVFIGNSLKTLPMTTQLAIVSVGLSFIIIIFLIPWLIAISIYQQERYLSERGE